MSSEPFDPYWQWLGVAADEQPPTHYRLLGLRELESDRDLISAAADQRLALVEAQRGGPDEAHCAHLLAEVAAARDCLLDPAAKASYDAALSQAVPMAMPVSMPAEAPHPPHVTPTPPPVAEPWDASETEQADEEDEASEPERVPWTWRGWTLVVFAVAVIAVSGWLLVITFLLPPDPQQVKQDPVEQEPVEEPPAQVAVMQEGNGAVNLRAVLAQPSGEVQTDSSGEFDLLAGWREGDEATWRFRVLKGGVFRVVIDYAAEDAWEGAVYELAVDDDEAKRCEVRGSGSAGTFHQDEYFIAVRSSGVREFTIRAVQLNSGGLLVLKSVLLEPKK